MIRPFLFCIGWFALCDFLKQDSMDELSSMALSWDKSISLHCSAALRHALVQTLSLPYMLSSC